VAPGSVVLAAPEVRQPVEQVEQVEQAARAVLSMMQSPPQRRSAPELRRRTQRRRQELVALAELVELEARQLAGEAVLADSAGAATSGPSPSRITGRSRPKARALTVSS